MAYARAWHVCAIRATPGVSMAVSRTQDGMHAGHVCETCIESCVCECTAGACHGCLVSVTIWQKLVFLRFKSHNYICFQSRRHHHVPHILFYHHTHTYTCLI